LAIKLFLVVSINMQHFKYVTFLSVSMPINSQNAII
jgi:hypothetical protein